MNPMTDERRRDNSVYWVGMAAFYRFYAQAPTLEPSPADFASLEAARRDQFHWCAVPTGQGVTYWGFSTADGRDAFLQAYPQATELAAEAVFGNPV